MQWLENQKLSLQNIYFFKVFCFPVKIVNSHKSKQLDLNLFKKLSKLLLLILNQLKK